MIGSYLFSLNFFPGCHCTIALSSKCSCSICRRAADVCIWIQWWLPNSCKYTGYRSLSHYRKCHLIVLCFFFLRYMQALPVIIYLQQFLMFYKTRYICFFHSHYEPIDVIFTLVYFTPKFKVINKHDCLLYFATTWRCMLTKKGKAYILDRTLSVPSRYPNLRIAHLDAKTCICAWTTVQIAHD